MASAKYKPNQQTVVPLESVPKMVSVLPIRKFKVCSMAT